MSSTSSLPPLSEHKQTHPPVVYLHLQTMQALPCPLGTYKDSISRAARCDPCPGKGITTAGVGSSSAAACTRAYPGYRTVRTPGAATLSSEPCPQGTFGVDGLSCMPCADNLTTQGIAHTSPADCLASPGRCLGLVLSTAGHTAVGDQRAVLVLG